MLVLCIAWSIGCGRIGFSQVTQSVASDAGAGTGDGSTVRDALVSGQYWQLVAASTNYSTTDGSLTISTVQPHVAAGDLLVVGIHLTGSPTLSISDSLGTSYSEAANAFATDNIDDVDLWFGAAAGSGSALIVVTASLANLLEIATWDFAIAGTASLDAAGGSNNLGSVSLAAGPLLAVAHAGDIVVGAAVGYGASVGSAVNGFVNDETIHGDGFAHLASAAAPSGTYQPAWNLSSATSYCADGAAFYIAP